MFFGYLCGLVILFNIEFWEWFFYYGMCVLLFYYMYIVVVDGGFGFS